VAEQAVPSSRFGPASPHLCIRPRRTIVEVDQSCPTVIAGSVAGSMASAPVQHLRLRGGRAASGHPRGDDAEPSRAPRRQPANPGRTPASRSPDCRPLRVGSRTAEVVPARAFRDDRSRIGRPRQTTRPASSPTSCRTRRIAGHESVLAMATRRPNATRPTRPAGTVFGSVIMKNRKIMTSGEVTIARSSRTHRQARTPSSPSCSGRSRESRAAARATQNVAASPRGAAAW